MIFRHILQELGMVDGYLLRTFPFALIYFGLLTWSNIQISFITNPPNTLANFG
jgi:hypothetical protein